LEYWFYPVLWHFTSWISVYIGHKHYRILRFSDMVHFLLIMLIILASYQVYAAFFRDLARKVWGWDLIPGMPKDLHAFTIAFRIVTIFILLFMILLYVLYII
jgi:hypothetical protein